MRRALATGQFERQRHFADDMLCARKSAGIRSLLSRLSTHARRKEHAMFDIVLLALGLVFFALSVAYAYVCERL
jgi:hypothetical protein